MNSLPQDTPTGLRKWRATEETGDPRLDRVIDAERSFEAATSAYHDMGVVFDAVAPQLHQAIAILEMGQTQRALGLFEEVAELYIELSFPQGEFGAKLGVAVSLSRLGRKTESEMVLSGLRKQSPEIGALIDRTIKNERIDEPRSSDSLSFFGILITAERFLNNGESR